MTVTKAHTPLADHVTATDDNAKATTNATRTRGEKLFDFITYWGINFFLNYGLSIVASDLFLGDKKKKADTNENDWEPSSYLAERFGGKTSQLSDYLYGFYESWRGRTSTTFLNLMTLSMGGHATAFGVKFMENRRDTLSKRFDGMLDKLHGHTPDEAEQESRQLRYKTIRETPTKSLGRVLLSRALALIVQYPVYQLIAKGDQKFLLKDKQVEEHSLGVKRLTRTGGNKIAQHFVDKNPDMPDMRKKRLFYWNEMILFETIGTSFVAGLMEFFIKFDLSGKFGFNGKKGGEQPATEEATAKTGKTTTTSAPASTKEHDPTMKVVKSPRLEKEKEEANMQTQTETSSDTPQWRDEKTPPAKRIQPLRVRREQEESSAKTRSNTAA